MRILIFLILAWSSTTLAEISRQDAERMIDEMVKTNTISKEEGEKAKIRLQTMSAHEWTDINQEAEQQAARMPASIADANVQTVPTDLATQQLSAIQSDLQVIAPEVTVNPIVVKPANVSGMGM